MSDRSTLALFCRNAAAPLVSFQRQSPRRRPVSGRCIPRQRRRARRSRSMHGRRRQRRSWSSGAAWVGAPPLVRGPSICRHLGCRHPSHSPDAGTAAHGPLVVLNVAAAAAPISSSIHPDVRARPAAPAKGQAWPRLVVHVLSPRREQRRNVRAISVRDEARSFRSPTSRESNTNVGPSTSSPAASRTARCCRPPACCGRRACARRGLASSIGSRSIPSRRVGGTAPPAASSVAVTSITLPTCGVVLPARIRRASA